VADKQKNNNQSKIDAKSIMNDTNGPIIKPGRIVNEGNTSFKLIDPVSDKPDIWYVRCSPMGAGFTRTIPKIIEMSEKRIMELYEAQLGRNALGNIRTVGERVGMRARL
jgi:hypothetical protein